LSWKLRNEYDSVFVHMNPEYVLASGLLWRFLGKKISLWYTHKSVDVKLFIAEKIVHHIFTASKESFRLKSKKLTVTGHGIDTDRFVCDNKDGRGASSLSLITVGRITKTKNISFLIEALAILKKRGSAFHFNIVGATLTEKDKAYENMLKAQIKQNNLGEQVTFCGSKTQAEIVPLLCGSDVFLHSSKTGSVDKAVLEAMSCGVVPVSTSEAFRDLIPQGLYVSDGARESFVLSIQKAVEYDRSELRKYIINHHGLPSLIEKLVTYFTV